MHFVPHQKRTKSQMKIINSDDKFIYGYVLLNQKYNNDLSEK